MARVPDGLFEGEDSKRRCIWCKGDELYQWYHDEEWGEETHDDHLLFEKICLEGFQAGLSWLTILKKRENFRKAFRGFDPARVARMNEMHVEKLLQNEGIIRHRGKIEATINNAKQALLVQKEFGSLDTYFWSFHPDPSERPQKATWAALKKLAETETSRALSKDLKKRGFRFVGPTTCYAFMQAMGMVNDHVEGCAFR